MARNIHVVTTAIAVVDTAPVKAVATKAAAAITITAPAGESSVIQPLSCIHTPAK